MKKFIAGGTVVAAWILTWALAVAAELPPVPTMPDNFKNITIIKPAPSLPKEVADFSGEWEGVWKFVGSTGDPFHKGLSFGQHIRLTKLIVSEVSPDKIKGLYGWGDSPDTGGKGGWRKFESELMDSGGRKHFTIMGNINMGFHLENGILKGSSGGNFEA
jgi:hypothetical protein